MQTDYNRQLEEFNGELTKEDKAYIKKHYEYCLSIGFDKEEAIYRANGALYFKRQLPEKKEQLK